ncbi:hypothetical protein SAMN02982929_01670 [Saccharopolyspora kobensis]|uniref:Uncharacterized protein n=1 Tax=Saccharopolyspora kobensis TaxID=146035 RepID=A0A1H5XWR8_9PSEU|nr:hypothetical protein SAMN02982929_01670 [Saccharopolyspora kobensis]SFF10600.1 hypothetical protein SAMN05216506_11972 [Saccharopolyspora kobensis]
MTHSGVEQLRLLKRIHLPQRIHFNRTEGQHIEPILHQIIDRYHRTGMRSQGYVT